MKRTIPLALIAAFLVSYPIISFSVESIDSVRYKIKGSDGNLWERYLGSGHVVRGEERPGTLTFTFDDGPDHRTTPILLDQLDRYGIKGTFFVNAYKFHPRTAGGYENQAVLRDMYRRGHFIGSHTFSHADLTTLDDDGWRNEVVQVEQVMRSVTGHRPWLFRPPFGKYNASVLSRLTAEGYTVVMWNLDSGDWQAKNAAHLLRNVQRLIEENPAGGVLLFHDTNRSTVEAIPLIVEWLEERNAGQRTAGKPTLEIVGIDQYIQSRQKKRQ